MEIAPILEIPALLKRRPKGNRLVSFDPFKSAREATGEAGYFIGIHIKDVRKRRISKAQKIKLMQEALEKAKEKVDSFQDIHGLVGVSGLISKNPNIIRALGFEIDEKAPYRASMDRAVVAQRPWVNFTENLRGIKSKQKTS